MRLMQKTYLFPVQIGYLFAIASKIYTDTVLFPTTDTVLFPTIGKAGDVLSLCIVKWIFIAEKFRKVSSHFNTY